MSPQLEALLVGAISDAQGIPRINSATPSWRDDASWEWNNPLVVPLSGIRYWILLGDVVTFSSRAALDEHLQRLAATGLTP